MQLKVGDLVRVKEGTAGPWGGHLLVVTKKDKTFYPHRVWFKRLSDGKEGWLEEVRVPKYVETPEEQADGH